jgi:hypothetical protein
MYQRRGGRMQWIQGVVWMCRAIEAARRVSRKEAVVTLALIRVSNLKACRAYRGLPLVGPSDTSCPLISVAS